MWHVLWSAREFWRTYFGHGAVPRNPRCELTLCFAVGDFDLGVTVDTSASDLFLDSDDRFQLGHLDAHFMNDALRWDELELLGRQLDPASPPWAIELLLLPYVALSPDLVDTVATRFATNLAATTAFSDAEVETLVDSRRRWVRTDLMWQLDSDAGGWVVAGETAYSLRRPGRFPFDHWRRLIEVLGT